MGTGPGKSLPGGQLLGLEHQTLSYLFKELIHEVVAIHVDHLLFIITVFSLGGEER